MKKIYLLLFIILLTGCNQKKEITIPKDDNTGGIKINQKVDGTNIKEEIGNIIKNKVNKYFDNNDFIVRTSASEDVTNNIRTDIYDFNLKLNEIRTTIGYTVFVIDNTVTTIYNNMNGYSIDTLKNSDKAIISKSKVDSYTIDKKNEAKQKVLNKDNITIISDEFIYNVNEDKTYYSIYYEHTDPLSGSMYADVYMEEL